MNSVRNESIPTVSVELLSCDEITAFLDRLDEAVEHGDMTDDEREELIYRQSSLWREA